MIYKPNKKEWKIGDVVIHDVDAKRENMLMKVVGIEPTPKKDMLYVTEYIDEKYHMKKFNSYKEFRNFKHNYLDLIEDLNDLITDDLEALADKTIYQNRKEEFDNFEADSVLEWIKELIKEKKEDGEEEGDYAWLEKWVEPLQEAKGFTIHLQWKPEW